MGGPRTCPRRDSRCRGHRGSLLRGAKVALLGSPWAIWPTKFKKRGPIANCPRAAPGPVMAYRLAPQVESELDDIWHYSFGATYDHIHANREGSEKDMLILGLKRRSRGCRRRGRPPSLGLVTGSSGTPAGGPFLAVSVGFRTGGRRGGCRVQRCRIESPLVRRRGRRR